MQRDNFLLFIFLQKHVILGMGAHLSTHSGFQGKMRKRIPKLLSDIPCVLLFHHRHCYQYRISSLIRQSFFLPKQTQKSRSVQQDGNRSLGLFRKGKHCTCIIAKFHKTRFPSYN